MENKNLTWYTDEDRALVMAVRESVVFPQSPKHSFLFDSRNGESGYTIRFFARSPGNVGFGMSRAYIESTDFNTQEVIALAQKDVDMVVECMKERGIEVIP